MLTFHNPGEINILGATVAGLSAKEGDSPIGFFGTGLKYSIACILRWGGKITIYSGTERFDFATRPLDFRGNAFSQILMNNEPLGFTTEYGKTWQPWQVFRELYANARDENGGVQFGGLEPARDTTTILVECPGLMEPYHARDTIILPEMDYAEATDDCLANPGPAAHIYYRGVRVFSSPSAILFNFQRGLQLTEDRTVRSVWEVQAMMAGAVQQFRDETLIERFIKSKHELDQVSWRRYAATSTEFISVARRLYSQDPAKYRNLRPIIEEHAKDLLEPAPIALSPIRQRMLDKACALAARMGVNPESCPIIVAPLGNATLGKYENGKVYLDPVNFDRGTKAVLSTLFEELIHHETGKQDCCYDMQTFLFDRIISLYEEHVFGEPI